MNYNVPTEEDHPADAVAAAGSFPVEGDEVVAAFQDDDERVALVAGAAVEASLDDVAGACLDDVAVEEACLDVDADVEAYLVVGAVGVGGPVDADEGAFLVVGGDAVGVPLGGAGSTLRFVIPFQKGKSVIRPVLKSVDESRINPLLFVLSPSPCPCK